MTPSFKDCVMILLEEYLKVSALKDAAYAERNKVVACMAAMAKIAGWKVGVALHDPADVAWEHEWRHIIMVDLPTGQVSWHIHDDQLPLFAGLGIYEGSWDGHTTPEKYERLSAFVRTTFSPT